MRSDPRRMFSFGATIHGTKFRIWLLCRAALFTFTPFDWFEVGASLVLWTVISNTSQEPDSLLNFFVLLATSSEVDLGFDTEIKRIGQRDLDLQFTIQGTEYHTLRPLYIGANATTGQGTRVFEVIDQTTGKVRVIKDSWVEDCPGRKMEHEIAADIRNKVGGTGFHKHFVGICGYRKTEVSGGFNSICDIFENGTFIAHRLQPRLLVPAPNTPRNGIADEDHFLQPTLSERTLGYPRFRYQVVYDEKGISLLDMVSLVTAFKHLGQAADGM